MICVFLLHMYTQDPGDFKAAYFFSHYMCAVGCLVIEKNADLIVIALS